MYETPKMKRFGTIRELTKVGGVGLCDGQAVTGAGNGQTPGTGPQGDYCRS